MARGLLIGLVLVPVGLIVMLVGLIVWLTNRNFDSPHHNARAWRAGRVTFWIGVGLVLAPLPLGLLIGVVAAVAG